MDVKLPSRIKTRNQPAWKGPLGDGITNSLLTTFQVCPERFWWKTIQGIKEDGPFDRALEFGQLWHECEEATAAKKDYRRKLKAYWKKLLERFPTEHDEVNRQYRIVSSTFPIYLDHWKRHPMMLQQKPVYQERNFRVPYTLPSGRVIHLRGKMDGVFRIKKRLWLLEHKTKGYIDEEGLTATLHNNQQVMIYLIALHTIIAEGKKDTPQGAIYRQEYPRLFDESFTIAGVLYNVIRRPLADNTAIQQRKGRLVNKKGKDGKPIKGKDGKPIKIRTGAENDRQFFQRLATVVKDDRDHYFKRWKVMINKKDIESFKTRCLHPALEAVCDWYEWCVDHNLTIMDRWRKPKPSDIIAMNGRCTERVPGGGIHFQTPWGIFNSMFGGFRGDYFDMLASGNTNNLITDSHMFPELEEIS